MAVSLGEEIMLLSLDDTTGAAKGESAARWGVAAACSWSWSWRAVPR